MAKRIHRKRTKGWRMPPGVVYCGRPTLFGNPFQLAGTFREWLTGVGYQDHNPGLRATILARLEELRGKDLACWCGLDEECHVDVLLELANR